MKILIVVQAYFPVVNGIGTQAQIVARELSRRHDVEIVAVDGTPVARPSGGSPAPSDGHGGIPVSVLNRAGVTSRLASVKNDLAAVGFDISLIYGLRYREQLRELMRHVDVVHCMGRGQLGWAALTAARTADRPFALTPYIHGRKRRSSASAALCRRADMVFGLMETDCRNLQAVGVAADRLQTSGVIPILPQATDPEAFRRRHGIGNAHLVLFVGRMVAYKGYEALRDAASRVWATEPNTCFVFAGPDEEGGGASIQRMGDDRLRYLGQISEQEKGDALAACDIFCMPSTHEIMPAVYLEAWSYGKPVIGGPALGLHELIEGNGAGVIAAPSADAVAGAVTALLSNPEQRRTMGERGRDFVTKKCSAAALAQAYESAYVYLVAARAAGHGEVVALG